MGNFLVNGVSELNSQKCGTLLIDILEKAPKFEYKPVFSETRVGENYLLETDNIFAHPFMNNSNYVTPSYDPFKDNSGLPSLDVVATEAAISAGSSASFLDVITNPIKSAAKTVYNTTKDVVSGIGNFIGSLFGKLVNFAKSFIGKVNSDREGNRIFSNGKSQAWCADFVTYCVKKTFGNKIPSDFGSSAVSGLMSWGRKHGCYLEAPFKQGLASMRNFLKTKVKPGDIMIEKRNGKSHTGIVTYVDPEGKFFKTVEGNTSDSVKERTYQADSKTLSGFVSLSKFA